MQNDSFLKEPLAGTDKMVTLILLRQKQLKDAINYTLNNILSKQKTVILASLSMEPKEILKMAPEASKKNLFIIDCFTRVAPENEQIISAGAPSDLTNIQVAIDSVEKKRQAEKTIVFDAMNVLSVYSNTEVLGKFLHLFCNKMLLKGNTTILFAIKEAMDEDALSMIKEFCDKTHDFSDALVTSTE